MNEIVYIIFSTKSSKSSLYFTLTAHLTLTGTFHVLSRHRWLVVTILDGAALEFPSLSLGVQGLADRNYHL